MREAVDELLGWDGFKLDFAIIGAARIPRAHLDVMR